MISPTFLWEHWTSWKKRLWAILAVLITGIVPAMMENQLVRAKNPTPLLIWAILLVFWLVIWSWAADIIGSLYVPSALKRTLPLPPLNSNETTVWHITMADAIEFGAVIDLKRTGITFLGTGFYVWETLDDCLRYIPKKAPKGVIAIAISNEQWHQLHAHIIPSKWSGQYWWLAASWPWRSIHCCNIKERTRDHLDTRWSRYDIVVGPGLQGRFSSRQILLRNTPSVKILLEQAEVIYYPVATVSKNR